MVVAGLGTRGSQVHTAPLTPRAGRNGPQGRETSFAGAAVVFIVWAMGEIIAQTWARTAAHTSVQVHDLCTVFRMRKMDMHMHAIECSRGFVRVYISSSICLPFPRKVHLVQHKHNLINYSVEWTVVLDQAQPWPAHSLCNQMDRFAVFLFQEPST